MRRYEIPTLTKSYPYIAKMVREALTNAYDQNNAIGEIQSEVEFVMHNIHRMYAPHAMEWADGKLGLLEAKHLYWIATGEDSPASRLTDKLLIQFTNHVIDKINEVLCYV